MMGKKDAAKEEMECERVREMEEGGRAWHHQCQPQLPGDG